MPKPCHLLFSCTFLFTFLLIWLNHWRTLSSTLFTLQFFNLHIQLCLLHNKPLRFSDNLYCCDYIPFLLPPYCLLTSIHQKRHKHALMQYSILAQSSCKLRICKGFNCKYSHLSLLYNTDSSNVNPMYKLCETCSSCLLSILISPILPPFRVQSLCTYLHLHTPAKIKSGSHPIHDIVLNHLHSRSQGLTILFLPFWKSHCLAPHPHFHLFHYPIYLHWKILFLHHYHFQYTHSHLSLFLN